MMFAIPNLWLCQLLQKSFLVQIPGLDHHKPDPTKRQTRPRSRSQWCRKPAAILRLLRWLRTEGTSRLFQLKFRTYSLQWMTLSPLWRNDDNNWNNQWVWPDLMKIFKRLEIFLYSFMVHNHRAHYGKIFVYVSKRLFYTVSYTVAWTLLQCFSKLFMVLGIFS